MRILRIVQLANPGKWVALGEQAKQDRNSDPPIHPRGSGHRAGPTTRAPGRPRVPHSGAGRIPRDPRAARPELLRPRLALGPRRSLLVDREGVRLPEIRGP